MTPASKPGEGTGRCTATTRDGEPCKAPPMTGRDVCTMHSETAPAVHAAGGRARAEPDRYLSKAEARGIKLADPCAMPRTLERLARYVLTGRLDPKVANCAAYLAATAIRASETAELAERLALLERAAELQEATHATH